MKKTSPCLLLLVLCIGCSSVKIRNSKNLTKVFTSNFYDNQFSGLLVVNPKNKDTLYNFNGKKYFTPASNTKIFTLFAALQTLEDSIPALKYIKVKDTLYVEGTGDPTLLHSAFNNTKTLNFLKKQKQIAIYLNNFSDNKYGLGWSWEDYQYYFQAEKSALPLFGNVATFYNTSSTVIVPSYFKNAVIDKKHITHRDIHQNKFYFNSSRKDTLEVPFKTDNSLTLQLLEDVLQTKLSEVPKMPLAKKSILYSVATDTVLKKMMHDSDNFIAEQLHLVGSSTLSDTLNSKKFRSYILETYLKDLNQVPRWVDGSGLSRYNLFTPESMVMVLSKLKNTVPRERLLSFFPAGGTNGTMKNWFAGKSKPYIYAKSGSLGNNYCLSGYLITNSGKTLVFSFMNNHFRKPTSEIKKQMELILEKIRDMY